MSTGAAIAATTEMLRLVLQNFLPDLSGALGQKPKVSAVPPDRIQTGTTEADQLNVFMYKAEPNAGMRNLGLPTRTSAGTRVSQPPMALNLHYLVSAYTKDDLHADVLLGYAMQTLYGMEILTSAAIDARFAGASPADVPSALWSLLTTSRLSEQAEQITLTLENQSNDDISKLWSVLGEKYRPSAAYVATVVLIQPEGPSLPAFPVTSPVDIVTLPVVYPRIASVEPADLAWTANAPLVVRGSDLLGPSTTVVFGDATAEPGDDKTPSELKVDLPDDIRAGIGTVRVRHLVDFASGTTTTLHQSNAISLVVRPVVGNREVLPATQTLPRRLRVNLTPSIGREQAADLLLNHGVVQSQGFTLPALPRAATSAFVDIDISIVPDGDYLLRVRVDGASSELTQDQNGFDGPTVTIA